MEEQTPVARLQCGYICVYSNNITCEITVCVGRRRSCQFILSDPERKMPAPLVCRSTQQLTTPSLASRYIGDILDGATFASTTHGDRHLECTRGCCLYPVNLRTCTQDTGLSSSCHLVVAFQSLFIWRCFL